MTPRNVLAISALALAVAGGLAFGAQARPGRKRHERPGRRLHLVAVALVAGVGLQTVMNTTEEDRMPVRSENEIEDKLNELDPEDVLNRVSKWPGMTYEQGVDAALRWAAGYSDDDPLED